jgi:hypothetical protein
VISDYLDSLVGALSFDRPLSGRVRQEVEDHLREAVAADPAGDGPEAERRAIANFGDPRVHRGRVRHGLPSKADQASRRRHHSGNRRRTDIQATRSRAMDIRATPDTPLTPVLRAMDTKATRDSQLIPPRVTDRQTTRDTLPTPDPRPLRRQAARDSPLTPVVRAMDIRARRPILRTPVPVSEIRSLAIPAIALRRTGRLGPSTRSSLLAEFWPDTKSSRRCAGGWSGR